MGGFKCATVLDWGTIKKQWKVVNFKKGITPKKPQKLSSLVVGILSYLFFHT